MRIESLDLLAYGHHRGTHLDLSRPVTGVTIVLGPNEAGKSTAMRALVSALFGVPTPALDIYAYGRAGLRIGLTLVDTRGRRLAFVRQGIGGAPLVDGDGGLISPEAVAGFLGGVDRQLYLRMFSVNHDELRMHSDELVDPSGDIGRLVFGAALGSGSVTRALQRLDQRAATLYTDRGRNQVVTAALNAYREGMRNARDERIRSREWDQRRAALATTDSEAEELTAALRVARADQSRLTWAAGALPLIAQRSDLTDELREITTEGPTASKDWAGRAASAVALVVEAQALLKTASSQKDNLERRLEGIVIAEGFLQRATRIDDVVQGVDSFTQAQQDLGTLRAELAKGTELLTLTLGKLGLTSDDARLVATSELSTVETLGQHRAALHTKLESAEEEIRKLDREVSIAQRQIQILPEPRDVAALGRATELARPAVRREEVLPARRQEVARLEAQARRHAQRLGFGMRDLADIEAIRVPAAQEIATAGEHREALATHLVHLDEEDKDLAGQQTDLTVQLDSLLAKPGIPDPAELTSARSRREAGWKLVRSLLESETANEVSINAWANGKPLPTAYERSVLDADAAADRRYEHAEDLTRLAEISAQRTGLTAKQEEARRTRDRLEAEVTESIDAWRRTWESIGVEAEEPRAMATWREAHQGLLAAIREVDDARRLLTTVEESITTHVEALTSAMADLGRTPIPASLGHLLAQAEEILADEHVKDSRRRKAEDNLERAASGRPDRDRAIASARNALADWERSWAEALAPLHLDAALRPESALEAAHAYRELPGARQAVSSLHGRIGDIERYLREFTAKAHAAAKGLVDVEGKALLSAVAELRAGLRKAREGASARDTLQSQFIDAEDAQHFAQIQADGRQEEVQRLRIEAEVPSDTELLPVIERTRRASDVRMRIEQIENTLVSQATGRTLERILTDTDELHMDGDELTAATETRGREVAEFEERLNEANQKLGEARKELAAVTEASNAADLEQAAQSQLAHAANYAEEYARTAVAAAVLRRAIREYGERHRGPILGRASAFFSRLTAGAFAELIPDMQGERQLLLARRRNGDLLTMPELSDGTRDQLYFGLRLAGIEHQLESLSESLPVLFDDVLVNFDDERSAATLATLAELGQRTQVVLFTHHGSVVELARSVLPDDQLSVIHLGAPDLSLPARRASGDVDEAAHPVGGNAPSGHAVLEALRAAGRPLSKADILVNTRIAESKWPSVIRSLVASGAVVQEGDKRGARYRVSP
jgi:uncharacterized protein YhaN